jgi:uncharacterized membrane protein
MEEREPRPGRTIYSSAGAERAPGRGPERVEAFSDGDIAIAITQLVLDLRVPAADRFVSPRVLLDALGELWPSYLGYLVSFVTIGIMWANHHNLFRHVRRVDHSLLLANLFLLLGVGFVPFPTALLAASIGEPTAQVGVLVYSGTFVAIALAFNVLWYRARKGGHLLRQDTRGLRSRRLPGATATECRATCSRSCSRWSIRRSAWLSSSAW